MVCEEIFASKSPIEGATVEVKINKKHKKIVLIQIFYNNFYF